MGELPERADFQAGVFTRSQAYDAGWTARQVRRRLEVGHWKVVAGAVIAPADLEVGAWQLAHAVVLSWPAAVVSHRLAALLHGFPVRADGIGSATLAAGQRLRGLGLRAYRVPLRQDEFHWLRGVPLTSRQRTAVDLLAQLPWSEARDLWAWVSTREVMTVATLEAEAGRRARRDGTPQLRRLIEASRTGSLSAAEDRMHDLLHGAGLCGWVANARVVVRGQVVAVVDILFTQARVVIQVDGWRSHGSREAFQRDRSQQNALVAAGYVVLRFTWDDLTRRPDQVVLTVRAALARAS